MYSAKPAHEPTAEWVSDDILLPGYRRSIQINPIYSQLQHEVVSYDLAGTQERKRISEAKAKEFYQKVVRQEQELRDLQKQSTQTEKQSTELQRQKADMEARLRELSGRLDATNQTLESLRSQTTVKKQNIQRDQSEMERYQEEVVRLDRQIGELMKRR